MVKVNDRIEFTCDQVNGLFKKGDKGTVTFLNPKSFFVQPDVQRFVGRGQLFGIKHKQFYVKEDEVKVVGNVEDKYYRRGSIINGMYYVGQNAVGGCWASEKVDGAGFAFFADYQINELDEREDLYQKIIQEVDFGKVWELRKKYGDDAYGLIIEARNFKHRNNG